MQIQNLASLAFWRSAGGIALLIALSVSGFFLFTGHRAHLLGALPYLFLLACPLMHVFMHHGHRHDHAPAAPAPARDDTQR